MKRASRGRPKNSGLKISPARVAALQSEGLTYTEIGTTLGISNSHVGKLLNRARTETAAAAAERLKRLVDAVNAADPRALELLEQWEPSAVAETGIAAGAKSPPSGGPVTRPVPSTQSSMNDIELKNVQVPHWGAEIDQKKHGYLSARIDCDLIGEMGNTLRRILLGCRTLGVTYPANGRVMRVESGRDVIKWLVATIQASECRTGTSTVT